VAGAPGGGEGFTPDWQDYGLTVPLPARNTPGIQQLQAGLLRPAGKAGVSRITPHGLRHTYTSLALRAGLPPKVVAARLRHADPTFTVKVYQQLMEEDHRAGALPLDTLLHLNSRNQRAPAGTNGKQKPRSRHKSRS